MKKTKILTILSKISTALLGACTGLCVYFAPTLLCILTFAFGVLSIVMSYILARHIKKQALTLMEVDLQREKDISINHTNIMP